MKIVAYTDGACSCNPGPGGWAAILSNGIKVKEISGAEVHTTNNRMELLAVIETVKYFEKHIVKNVNRSQRFKLDIYSDSAYVVNSVKKGWLKKWVKNGFKKTKGGEIQNIDLWQELNGLLRNHEVTIIKVKGHDGNELNEKADKLAYRIGSSLLAVLLSFLDY